MRHPFEKRYGINPSVTYDKTSGVTTMDAAGYARVHAAYAGVRLGNESTHQGRGGFFATGFVGWGPGEYGPSGPSAPGRPEGLPFLQLEARLCTDPARSS